jgi:peptide/nickel transport system permease protein
VEVVTTASVTTPEQVPDVVPARARGGLRRFVLRRVAAGLITLVAASIIVFVGTTVLPGSPGAAVLGKAARPEVVAKIDHRLGWDKPPIERYLTWLGKVARGDLGDSSVGLAQGAASAPVWQKIRGPLSNTASLALVTVLLLIPLSLVLGVTAGVYYGRWPDHVISTLTVAFVAMPEFVIGSLLTVVFFSVLDVLPPVSLVEPGTSPFLHPNVLVLPVLTLLIVLVPWTARLVRTGTIEVLESDYVETARLRGIPERTVLRRYVLRNALGPSVQIFALSVQYLFGGVIITEAVFSYPGIGKQLVDAVVGHDNTLIQAIALILAGLYILINIVADVVLVLLVPKLRTQV